MTDTALRIPLMRMESPLGSITMGERAHTIETRNVNDAYRLGCNLIAAKGREADTRNGMASRVPGTITTVYSHPYERVLFDAQRNANPFFHLFESLWMLNGQNDVETMHYFNKTFKQFSDDGETYHGAYGHRWRHWPLFIRESETAVDEIDQLVMVTRMLEKDPGTRRAIIAMWDPVRDLGRSSRDIPCNDFIKVDIEDGRLHITVFNRSNDIVWGCYGANAVHMSVLHEYLAAMCSVLMGTYTQVSSDYHAYLTGPYQFFEQFYPLQLPNDIYRNPYLGPDSVKWMPLVTNPASFNSELAYVMNRVRGIAAGVSDAVIDSSLENTFFVKVVAPMLSAWCTYKNQWPEDALDVVQDANAQLTQSNDWLCAAEAWILRQQEKRHVGRAD